MIISIVLMSLAGYANHVGIITAPPVVGGKRSQLNFSSLSWDETWAEAEALLEIMDSTWHLINFKAFLQLEYFYFLFHFWAFLQQSNIIK